MSDAVRKNGENEKNAPEVDLVMGGAGKKDLEYVLIWGEEGSDVEVLTSSAKANKYLDRREK